MFSLDSKFTHLAVRRDQVLALIQSMNALSVKVPGYPTSPAMGYVAAWAVGGDKASAVVYLHYAGAQRAAAYLSQPAVFPLIELPTVTEAAIEFLESMGFMLDDAAFGTRKAEEQIALMRRTPLFHADLAGFAEAREGKEQPVMESAPTLGAGATESVPPSRMPTPEDVTRDAPAESLGRLLMSF